MIDYQKEKEKQKIQQTVKEKSDMEKLIETFCTAESQEDPNFFLGDNGGSKKKKSQYSSTKMKGRNFLTNAAYRRFKEEEAFNKPSFVTDIATFLIQSLNPIALDRKLETDPWRNHVKMIWDKCLPQKFTLFILMQKNYLMLSETQVTYQKAIDILNEFLDQNQTENFDLLKESLAENINLIRYVYSTLFLKIYNRMQLI